MKVIKKMHYLTVFFIIFLIGLLPVTSYVSYANEPNILMFLWQGETDAEKGFRDVLFEQFPDQNINIKVHDAYKDINRLRNLIDNTDEKEYQLIYTYGSTVTSNVVKSIINTPLVFDVVYDPISYKIVESWDKKSPNITGVSNSIPINIQLDKLKEVFGKGVIGFIYDPMNNKSLELKEDIEGYMEVTKDHLAPYEFRKNFRSLRKYLNSMKKQAKCIYLASDRNITQDVRRILSMINRMKIPTFVTSKSYLKQGALMCISVQHYKVGRMAGRQASQILKGVQPADLPILRPSDSDVELYANATIVKRLKLKLPEDMEIIYVTK